MKEKNLKKLESAKEMLRDLWFTLSVIEKEEMVEDLSDFVDQLDSDLVREKMMKFQESW